MAQEHERIFTVVRMPRNLCSQQKDSCAAVDSQGGSYAALTRANPLTSGWDFALTDMASRPKSYNLKDK
ncbi:MAG: hypothetical protein ABF868_01285 [Sporolactobacillus sp.]